MSIAMLFVRRKTPFHTTASGEAVCCGSDRQRTSHKVDVIRHVRQTLTMHRISSNTIVGLPWMPNCHNCFLPAAVETPLASCRLYLASSPAHLLHKKSFSRHLYHLQVQYILLTHDNLPSPSRYTSALLHAIPHKAPRSFAGTGRLRPNHSAAPWGRHTSPHRHPDLRPPLKDGGLSSQSHQLRR
jgi:hypothetical protein